MKNFKLILASDHRGFMLKKALYDYLIERGYRVLDIGNNAQDEADDYVDFASIGAKMIMQGKGDRGIFICGSGHGMDIVANKYVGIRSVIGFNDAVAQQSREHEDANVLVLPSDWVSVEDAKKRVDLWLSAIFKPEERHIRRINKIKHIEEQNFHVL